MRLNENVHSLAVLASLHLRENIPCYYGRVASIKVADSSIEQSPKRGVCEIDVIFIKIRDCFTTCVLVSCWVLKQFCPLKYTYRGSLAFCQFSFILELLESRWMRWPLKCSSLFSWELPLYTIIKREYFYIGNYSHIPLHLLPGNWNAIIFSYRYYICLRY